MEFTEYTEANLFEESDNESNANVLKDNKFKRKRDLNDTDAKDQKKVNKQDSVCEKEADIKSKCFQTRSNFDIKKRNSVETNQLWSIEETLFYPIGIRTHYIVGVNRSVLLIWSFTHVINFVIKKNPNTKQTKMTRIRLFVPNGEQIKDILVLEFNTLLLLESGCINYFSSSKSMHKLPWLDNVRCFAVFLNGFSVIRLTSERKLVLEVYEDAINMGKNATGHVKNKYDITFDEQNLFNCTWEDEHYYLLSTVINKSNLKFLQLVTRNALNLDHQTELHFFAISGNVFLLIPDIEAATYHIEMLFSYSSNVAIIKIDFERNFLFIFLQCGVIDVWYMSSKWQHLRHQTHSIGVEYTSFSYSENRAALYFTDGNEVAEFRFSKTTEGEELALHETYKAIPGILICTWIEAIEQLVCLDCNNIVHQLNFDPLRSEDRLANVKTQPVIKTAEFEKFNTLFELTPQRVAQLLEKAQIIQQLNELPKIIYHNIEQQYRKQQLLAVSCKRRLYNTLLNARLEFSIGALSCFQNDVIPLYTENHSPLHIRSLLALIYVEIKENEMFQSSIWQLHLQFEGLNHVFTVSKALMRNKLCLIVPLDLSMQKLFPEFHMHLYTFVSCARNYVTIALPVSIVINYDTIAQLFTMGKVYCTKRPHSRYRLEDLLKNFDKQPKSFSFSEVKCCLNVPKTFKLKSILKTSKIDELISEEKSFELIFLGSQISVCHNVTENNVVLNSVDATALFYTKMHLQHVCEQQQIETDTRNSEDARQKLLRYHCNVPRLYGTLQDVENDELNEKPHMIQKLKLLNELYLKIRKELSQPLFL